MTFHPNFPTKPKELASLIDHALLSPTLREAELEAGCALAAKEGVASVCVRPCSVSRAKKWLEGSGVKVGTVIGFPQGSHHPDIKLAESAKALADGATELDMVINLGWAMDRDFSRLTSEVAKILELAHRNGALLKVILETAKLPSDIKVEICRHVGLISVDFVKTSTGYGDGGATVEDVLLLRNSSPSSVQVKASGGIRTLEQALALLKAGATRLGTGSTADLMNAARLSWNHPG
jgi:deoxyribose-phosphate aldolase